MINWVAYVRPVDLDQELVPLSVTYPLQQTLIPLTFYFLGVDWINLRTVCRHGVLVRMYVIGHHHFVEVHVLEGRPLLGSVCLYHLLLYYELLLLWKLIKLFFCDSWRQRWHLRHLHPEWGHTFGHARCWYDLGMTVL